MRGRRRAEGSKERPVKRRKLRERPTPRWLQEENELDEIARRRCLMILSVLSGEKPVTEAIAEAKISRGTYYKLEEKAIQGMLASLLPGAAETGGGEAATQRLLRMEKRLTRMEREKRRSERLLYLTRQVIKPGPMKDGKRRGRPPSIKTGSRPSPASKKTMSPEESPSIQTADGAGAP